MHIIKLTPCEPGVYSDHKADHITVPPEGWAYIPEDFPLPGTFPRLGSIEAEERTYTREVETVDENGKPAKEERKYTMLTVTAMTEGTLPEPEPEPEPVKTPEERIAELEEALELLLSGDTGEEVADDEA